MKTVTFYLLKRSDDDTKIWVTEDPSDICELRAIELNRIKLALCREEDYDPEDLSSQEEQIINYALSDVEFLEARVVFDNPKKDSIMTFCWKDSLNSDRDEESFSYNYLKSLSKKTYKFLEEYV